ncbi:flagellar biosynthesis protein FliP [Dinoroseobacter shibae DFL 12 = DSM 16493]|jgi:flagellar biosynthetic protein FliP|uniref:Flagellar biosynthetic protein FliP n=1 Tax=Dinoroseobacter shibae (strain DSM 16493 / NCIMB 14021 / DFL 12) TaxID=398580 RepID=A8LMS5_DINSH|nr:flagellar type III secretion system pore protein FliP [Dinoroseobacter shibae]ABV95000.1 flagellar biosynthesis protein FliP [Dinoroseobacter shibae DFL 12 = DSM 16493]URF46419.1 flagellar type III secretion system pore protein FliP [Dinoroseobacter shibae]URF50725.1 flagellar type III secretion system pore protein FliP [Dinoroseobacter shibae]
MRLALAFALLALFAGSAGAQELAINLGDETSLSARTFQIIALITVLSIAPGLAIMITCFPFMVTVLSILRQGIGLQQSPPNMLIISLALFLTYFVMDPVFREAWSRGIQPMVDGAVDMEEGFRAALEPFIRFMQARTDPETLARLGNLRMETAGVAPFELDAPPISVLIPSFLLSEIEKAFQIGFLIFLPFLIIDLIVAAILMSMGMMMVPPAIVSLPFKLAFFVVADGWTLLSEALLRSYM